MDFSWLYRPVELLDEQLAAGLGGAGLGVVLLLAVLLGLRHALDPDHLVAVTSLVAGENAGPGAAARLGACWGAGHAGVLLAAGLPLTASGSLMPPPLEQAAERAIGVVIGVLAVRVRVCWWCARRGEAAARSGAGRHCHAAVRPRTLSQAAAIGVLHGLGGTGAVTLLFLTVLPDRSQAMLALAVFAPMSVASMAVCTGVYAWAVQRGGPVFAPSSAMTPLFGIFGLAFGGWYAGVL